MKDAVKGIFYAVKGMHAIIRGTRKRDSTEKEEPFLNTAIKFSILQEDLFYGNKRRIMGVE